MLAFDRQGSGRTAVVLLHGVGGGRSIWSDAVSGTARAIAEAGFTAIALDLPGYGDSLLQPPLSTASMAGEVAQVIRSLALGPAMLLGHSMGGMVALELAATEPGLVRALVLACTSSAFGAPGGDWQQQFLRDRLAPLDAGEGMPALARRLVAGMVAPGADPAAVDRAVDVMARVPEATYRAALTAIVGFDRRAALAGLRLPVLCLAAEHDRTAPPDVMQRMAQRIAGAEFACVAAAGHLANVEQPRSFNDAVAGFLARSVADPET
jgi:3-oxoadipate enol-lactonase